MYNSMRNTMYKVCSDSNTKDISRYMIKGINGYRHRVASPEITASLSESLRKLNMFKHLFHILSCYYYVGALAYTESVNIKKC